MNCSAGRRNLWTRLRIVWIRPQKAPDSSSSGSGSSSSGGHGSGGSQDTVSGQDAYQVPAGGLWEIDVKAQGCSVEIAPGDPGSQVSVVLERQKTTKSFSWRYTRRRRN